jgi:predicted metal-dependent hydrolase
MDQLAVERARERSIRPRQLKLDIPEGTPRYWMGGDPYATHLLNALSITFPPGERFFMASVRALRDRITDPVLREQVKGFLAQESLHSREHTALNAWLTRMGYAADRYEAEVADDIARHKQGRAPIEDLAVTCALEHFTAIMAETWLKDPELRAQCDASVRDLWTWHAIEELDHKAVAFDVYQAANGPYALRALVMIGVTVGLIWTATHYQRKFMKHDGQHKNWKVWARGFARFWGPRGYFPKLIPAYLRYFRPDFHPWQQDDAETISAFETALGYGAAA